MFQCRTLSILALILAGFLAGCSDDGPTQPEIYAGIHGTVVDTDGEPLAGVAVGLIYDIPGISGAHPAEKPTTEIGFSLPEPGHVLLWITDYAGDFVTTLYDDPADAGRYTVTWPGRDASGDPIPAGMYSYHLQIDDQPPTVHELFLHFLDPADFLNAPNAVTDADGIFQIPDTLIPVGETITATNVLGEEIGEVTITSSIQIRAVRPGDPNPIWSGLTINYLSAGANGDIELTLP